MGEGLGALSVLVIDDNAQMRMIIGTVLTGVGVRQLHYAADGNRGLNLLSSARPDIVYVDYEMPIINGLEFIRRVRSSEGEGRYLPIIMLTGHSDQTRLKLARDAGMTEFVAKPVSPKTIIQRLNSVIMAPRPFVNSPTYFGPDRRRLKIANYAGPLRRGSDNTDTRV